MIFTLMICCILESSKMVRNVLIIRKYSTRSRMEHTLKLNRTIGEVIVVKHKKKSYMNRLTNSLNHDSNDQLSFINFEHMLFYCLNKTKGLFTIQRLVKGQILIH